MKTLNFDEEITLDYNTLPFDDSEGAYKRDLELCEMLYNFDTDEDLCETLEKADIWGQI